MSFASLAAILAAFVGALMGGLVTEFRGALEIRRDRRKQLNRVLWCQLDLWAELRRHDFKDPMRAIMRKIAIKSGMPEEQLLNPPTQFDMMMEILSTTLLADHDPELSTRYDQAVAGLAPIDPILAYQLSGKTSVVAHREDVASYLSTVNASFGMGDPVAPDALAKMNPLLNREMLVNALSLVEDDIHTVAHELGRKTRRDVKRLLRKLEERIETDMKEDIDKAADRALAVFHELAQQLSFVTQVDPNPHA